MPNGKRIKVLIVDDSMLFREVLSRGISTDSEIEVVGKAEDPMIAAEMIKQLQPDVLTLDVQMPKMNGIEFLKTQMKAHPVPVVVVSSVSSNVFDALNAGAVDFVTKPEAGKPDGSGNFIAELLSKIKIAAVTKAGAGKAAAVQQPVKPIKSSCKIDIIAIGASTGGTEAISDILTALPADVPGIVITQHMPPLFTKMFADRLNRTCKMEVLEAKNGDLVQRGRVLIAPGDFQMKIKRNDKGLFAECQKGEKVSGHCPSVDVLFDSVSRLNNQAVGIILTGMGSDGAKGLLSMKNSGAYTIGQEESSCIVYGMPKVAFEMGGVLKVVPLGKIAEHLITVLNQNG